MGIRLTGGRVGAQVARPNDTRYLYSGDGSFMMNNAPGAGHRKTRAVTVASLTDNQRLGIV